MLFPLLIRGDARFCLLCQAAGFLAIRIRQMTRLMRCLTLTSVRKLRSWTRFTLRSFVCLHRSPRTNALPNLTHLLSILRPARHRYNC